MRIRHLLGVLSLAIVLFASGCCWHPIRCHRFRHPCCEPCCETGCYKPAEPPLADPVP